MNTTRGVLSYYEMTGEDMARWMLRSGYRDEVAVSVYCCGKPEEEEKYARVYPEAFALGSKSRRDEERDPVTGEKHLRTPVEKLSDIAANFVAEDTEVALLTQGGLTVTYNTTDADRSFIDRHEQSSEADCVVTIDDEPIKVEIVNDWGSYWMNRRECTLRGRKAYDLRRDGVILLGFNLPHNRCFLKDMGALKDGEIQPVKRYHGWSANIPVAPYDLHEIDPAYIAAKIRGFAESRKSYRG